MRRKKAGARRWMVRLFGAAVLVLALGIAFAWWNFIHWTPSRAAFPVQGIVVGKDDGQADFRAFKAIGADFAYLEASRGTRGRDANFTRNLAAARAAGIRVGAIHRYDPCLTADRQSANFVTVVPRDSDLLPPAIELDRTADDCPRHVMEPSVESELMTFLNQVEGHAAKPALLKISPRFEARYRIATRFERALWLTRDRFQPGYAGRPWTMWTANSALRSEASELPVRWVVVQP